MQGQEYDSLPPEARRSVIVRKVEEDQDARAAGGWQQARAAGGGRGEEGRGPGGWQQGYSQRYPPSQVWIGQWGN